uniref:Phospholipase A2 n=1 Tax=Pelusios castaneus TaxID=367368 RepID=A0A8C8R5R9_9SAUR
MDILRMIFLILNEMNRRGILELAGTIKCSTGRTPLAYLDYGCYCGLGGQGWPRDKKQQHCFHKECILLPTCNKVLEGYSLLFPEKYIYGQTKDG